MTYRLFSNHGRLELFDGYRAMIVYTSPQPTIWHLYNMPQTARSGVDFTHCADTIRKAWLNTLP